jgi:Myb-like DNA-binding domain
MRHFGPKSVCFSCCQFFGHRADLFDFSLCCPRAFSGCRLSPCSQSLSALGKARSLDAIRGYGLDTVSVSLFLSLHGAVLKCAYNRAVEQHGEQWKIVAGLVGRSDADCRDRYRNHLKYRCVQIAGAQQYNKRVVWTRNLLTVLDLKDDGVGPKKPNLQELSTR